MRGVGERVGRVNRPMDFSLGLSSFWAKVLTSYIMSLFLRPAGRPARAKGIRKNGLRLRAESKAEGKNL